MNLGLQITALVELSEEIALAHPVDHLEAALWAERIGRIADELDDLCTAHLLGGWTTTMTVIDPEPLGKPLEER